MAVKVCRTADIQLHNLRMMRSAAGPHGRVDGRRKSLPISPVYTVTGFPSLMQRGVAELFSHAMFRTRGTRSPAPAGHGAGSVERLLWITLLVGCVHKRIRLYCLSDMAVAIVRIHTRICTYQFSILDSNNIHSLVASLDSTTSCSCNSVGLPGRLTDGG